MQFWGFTDTTSLHSGHRRLLKFLAVCVLLFNLHGYWFALGVHPTDPYSEGRRYRAAMKLAQGQHRFGIVAGDQTHYPNGPAYVLVPWIYLGVDDESSLRWIPVIFACVAQALLLYAFYKSRLSWVRKILLMLMTALLFNQPGIRHWVGALHVQSYIISIAVLLMAFALLWPGKLWLFALSGFVAGWIGYDAIPTQAAVVFGATFFGASIDRDPFTAALKKSCKLLCFFTGGVLLAVILHVVQNSLYFGSFDTAMADLFGSAGTRMGLDTHKFNPDYYNYIRKATAEEISRTSIAVSMWRKFWLFGAVKREIFMMVLLFATLGCVSLYLYKSARNQFVANSILMSWICFISFGAWIWLMPYHAYHHLYYLLRNFLMTLLLIFTGTAFLTSPGSREKSQTEFETRAI